MRIVPMITAVLVVGFLYFLVFERDRLVAFARSENAEEAAPETTAPQAVPDAPADAVGVVALKSRAREIDTAVILRGQTEADAEVEVRSETSAVVVSAPLRKGHFVETGEVLCRLDPGTRPTALAEAQARLAEAEASLPAAEAAKAEAEARVIEAEARLNEAQINDNAARQLSEGGFASTTRVATTLAGVRSAEAGVQAARSGLESARRGIASARSGIQAAESAIVAAQTEIDRLTITAPFAGVLETDTAELGSFMQQGSLCATVMRLDPIKVVGFVPETDVDRVEVGAQAGARLISGREIVGRVTFLSRSADETTRTFRTEIEVANPDFSIRDGQTAEILIGAEGRIAHLLPASALTLDNLGRLGVRVVDADGIVDFVPVTILRDTMEGVWLGGLPDEADVIVMGQDFVSEGVRVAVTYREAAK